VITLGSGLPGRSGEGLGVTVRISASAGVRGAEKNDRNIS
jgi:hypothetical protein